MTETLSDSPRSASPEGVQWLPWGAAAFAEAERLDRPVLLYLVAPWCAWCRRMDATTYAAPSLVERINAECVPIRVDGDRHPHVLDRYIAGGWPTNAFLTPTGEVLWAGTHFETGEFSALLDQVVDAWTGRRDELELEIERRRRALDAARSQNPALGLVRREAADDVLLAIEQSFDPRNGGFGDAPKFPVPEAIELLFSEQGPGHEGRVSMAEHTLDGMISGELRDTVEGGFYRYALNADWTKPRYEKMLSVNAGQLLSYTLGAHLLDREDWRAVAEETVQWVHGTLRQPNGLWGGSQAADEVYAKLDEDGRRARPRPAVDPVIYTDANALWIRALAEAGARLGVDEWVEMAVDALDTLIDEMAAATGLFYHFRAPDTEPQLEGLLVDCLEVARASLTVAQASGRTTDIDRAREIAATMRERLWAEKGGFNDHASLEEPVGALRYSDRPFDRNASVARLFLDLAFATGERSYRAIAERTLAVLSPLAGRYGVMAAEFALAVDEFFEAPPRVVLVGTEDETAELRRAGLALREPTRRVWTLDSGGRLGPLSIPTDPVPAAYACSVHACSPPIDRVEALGEAVEAIR